MPGICLTFDNDTKQAINKIYQKVNEKLGEVLKIDSKLEPHFTLLYHPSSKIIDNLEDFNQKIDLLANQFSKNVIKIEGYGIFQRGDNYILYLSTAYDTRFQEIHKKAWQIFEESSFFDKTHYHHTSYIPHLTIPLINQNIDIAMNVLKELMNRGLSNIVFNNTKIEYLTANLSDPKVYYSKELNE